MNRYRHLTYAVLDSTPTDEEVKARSEGITFNGFSQSDGKGPSKVFMALLVMVYLLFAGPALAFAYYAVRDNPNGQGMSVLMSTIVGLVIAAILILVVPWFGRRMISKFVTMKTKTIVAMDMFAEQNGFTKIIQPNYAGTIWGGSMPTLFGSDVYGDGIVEFGTLHYGKSKERNAVKEVVQPYVMMRLARSAPRVVLDSTANDQHFLTGGVQSSLNDAQPSASLQVLSDISQYHTVYAGDAVAAEQLLRSRAGAALMEHARFFDIEITQDGRLYMYAGEATDIRDGRTLPSLMAAVSHVAEGFEASQLPGVTMSDPIADDRAALKKQQTLRSITYFAVAVLVGLVFGVVLAYGMMNNSDTGM